MSRIPSLIKEGLPVQREMEARRMAGIHTLQVENRQKIIVTGVEELGSFCEEEVVLFTSAGVLSIEGESLHIDRLSLEDGQFIVSGLIDAVSYQDEEEQPRPLLARIFKR